MPKVATGPMEGQTFSEAAYQVGADLGMPPDEDQREILDAIYRVKEDDLQVPACFEVAIVAPRQNIKTSTLEIAALTDLFVFREPLAIWTAHLYSTSSKTFKHMRQLIESAPEYRRLCRWPPRTANGDQAIELLTGEAIEFYARSKRAIRGFAGVAKITLDEALFLNAEDLGAMLPTTAVIPGAQIRYASSAGVVTSSALRSIRDRGHVGEDELAYFEWYAAKTPCADAWCTHQKGADGCALDDPELWAEANPALGRRISKARMRQFRNSMPPEEFAREFLTWWDEGPDSEGRWQVISESSWSDAADRESQPGSTIAIGVDVKPDRSFGSICIAGQRDDDMWHVELIDRRPGTEWIVQRVAELDLKWSPVAVVVDEVGPAGSLIGDLEQSYVSVVKMNTRQVTQAAAQFFDALVHAKTVRHRGQPELDTAVAKATKRPLVDSWAWSRKDPAVDVSPLVAASNALWGLTSHLDAGGLGPDDVYVGRF